LSPLQALANPPGDTEPLARFIVELRHVDEQSGRAKFRALLPAQDNSTSVFRVFGLDQTEIWHLGDQHVAPFRGKPILGRAELLVHDVKRVGLDIEPDDEPPRHAAIVGWPAEKDAKKIRAMELATTTKYLAR
jgi:hypothetical protein